MNALAPLDTLYDLSAGPDLALPRDLAALYGRLAFRSNLDRPTVIGNFVTTLDGVVSLGIPGRAGGGEISGFNPHDRMVMGLLRAVADAVIVGAGTLREVPGHLWTAEHIFPPLNGAFQELRVAIGKSARPLNVIVTASGKLDPRERVFQSGEVPSLIVTTTPGAERIRASGFPASVLVTPVSGKETISPSSILAAVGRVWPGNLILTEGGPRLIGDFFAERRLDDLFLTIAPQIAGRDDSASRPGLVAGHQFAPEHPRWGTLVSIKRGVSHLFLRYTFDVTEAAS